MKISKALMVALMDCARFNRGNYIWKPKSMERLAALGLVEIVPTNVWQRADATAYGLTRAGIDLLESEDAKP